MIRKILALSLLTFTLAGVPASGHGDTHEEFSCIVDVGTGIPGVGTVGYQGSPAGNLGSCEVATLSQERNVSSVDPADSCSINYDENGDGLSNTPVEENQTYASGTTFIAFCEVGVINGENSVTVHDPDDPVLDDS